MSVVRAICWLCIGLCVLVVLAAVCTVAGFFNEGIGLVDRGFHLFIRGGE